MSTAASPPPSADHELLAINAINAINALARAGNFDAAVARLQSRIDAHPGDHAAWHQLARIEAQRRRNMRALKAAQRAAKLAPDNAVYQRHLGLALANAGAGKEAMSILTPIVEANAEDYLAMHALHIACYKAGDAAHTLKWGGRMLALEDRLQIPRTLALPADTALPARKGRQKLIAYSLWGAKPAYNMGAMVNARIAHFIYPGWTSRFYLAADVPAATRQALLAAGAQVVDAWLRHPGVSPSMWRFLPADDANVGVFICRDCDSRLSPKEAAAVDAWLASGKWGHVMRDHLIHRNVMLAGLWGARNDGDGERRLFMRRRLQRFLKGQSDARHGADQHFLAKEIWPVLRDNCCVHDSYYPLFGAQPFPVMSKGNDRFHVGMSVMREESIKREAQLLGLTWPVTASGENG
ncbi:MAG: tetratricopeptide repeat protein [Burkholderiales bacterium]